MYIKYESINVRLIGHVSTIPMSSLLLDATAQDPWPFKSRRSLRATSNLYI